LNTGDEGVRFHAVNDVNREVSYLESADQNRDADSDETAGPAETGEVKGVSACGSDKSAGLLSRSSNSKGNIGLVADNEPGYEEDSDE
jgi:hypothetical protein